MLQTLLGPERFRKGMDLYFERHDGEAATVEQFVQCFADVSNDLTQFMRWYSQAGTPEVVASGQYDPAAKTYRLDLAQTIAPTPNQPTKEPMVIPLVTGLVGRDGRDLPLTLATARPSSAACWSSTARRRASSSPTWRAAGAVAQPRLLGADQGSPPTSPPTICGCWRRMTAIRSTAGRRCRRSPARCWSATWRGCAPAATPRRMKACSTRSTRSSPTRRSSRPSSRKCCIRRAKPTSPARSAATSIPTRSSRRATGLRAADGAASHAALRATYREPRRRRSPTARTRSAPGGACSRTSASICSRRRRKPTPSASRQSNTRPPTT